MKYYVEVAHDGGDYEYDCFYAKSPFDDIESAKAFAVSETGSSYLTTTIYACENDVLRGVLYGEAKTDKWQDYDTVNWNGTGELPANLEDQITFKIANNAQYVKYVTGVDVKTRQHK